MAGSGQLEQHTRFGLILADVDDVIKDQEVILVELGKRAFERGFAACDLQPLDEIAGAHEQHAPSILDECEADAPTVTRAVPRRPPSARRGDPVAARPAHWQAVWELSAQEAAGMSRMVRPSSSTHAAPT